MLFTKMPRVYVAAPMRSGSTLVSNILNAHSKVQIIENFHFKRFIFNKGGPLTKKIVAFKLREMEIRLKIRYNIRINAEKVLKEIFKKKLTYKNIYDELIREQLNMNPNINIVGEDSAMNWRFIDKFCEYYDNAKVIHIIRDPRSVFASWKKATYQKKDYWGCILNCLDNMNYAKYYVNRIDKKKYMIVKFEDILKRPKFFAKKFSKFLKIKYEENMIKPKKWEKLFKNKFASLGWSSIEKRAMDGFFTNRIDSWKSILTDEEAFIIEHYARKNLQDFGYEYSQKNLSKKYKKMYINNFNKIKNQSKYLKRIFNFYEKNQIATDELKNNPRDPRTWGDGKNNKLKFIDSKDGYLYMKKLKQIKQMKIKNEK